MLSNIDIHESVAEESSASDESGRTGETACFPDIHPSEVQRYKACLLALCLPFSTSPQRSLAREEVRKIYSLGEASKRKRGSFPSTTPIQVFGIVRLSQLFDGVLGDNKSALLHGIVYCIMALIPLSLTYCRIPLSVFQRRVSLADMIGSDSGRGEISSGFVHFAQLT